MEDEVKIGLYICHWGTHIAGRELGPLRIKV
jgi:hypothetical protein